MKLILKIKGIGILDFSDVHDCVDLQKASFKYILQNFSTVSRTIFNIDYRTLTNLISKYAIVIITFEKTWKIFLHFKINSNT